MVRNLRKAVAWPLCDEPIARSRRPAASSRNITMRSPWHGSGLLRRWMDIWKLRRTATLIHLTKIDVWLHSYVIDFYLPLINKHIYPLKVVKLLWKRHIYDNCRSSFQMLAKRNSVNSAYWNNFDIYSSRHETLPQAYTRFCNKHSINILLLWADRYLKNTLQSSRTGL
jgi:hypothetical protein